MTPAQSSFARRAVMTFISIIALTGMLPAADPDLFTGYPTLARQLEASLPDAAERARAAARLRAYLRPGTIDHSIATRLLLADDWFRPYLDIVRRPPPLDGTGAGWEHAPFVREDARGNVQVPNADLVEFRCFLDTAWDLPVRFTTAARPKMARDEEQFWVEVRVGTTRLMFGFGGDVNLPRIEVDGKRIARTFQWKTGAHAEARLPLGAVLDDLRLSRPRSVTVMGRVWHPRLGVVTKEYNPPGFYYKHTLTRIDFTYPALEVAPPVNHALRLLVRQLETVKRDDHDSIYLALALVNSPYVAAGDDTFERLVFTDIQRHRLLYGEITVAQRRWPHPYALATTPFLAKLYWTDRGRLPPRKGRPVADVYREAIDRVDDLRAYRTLALDHGFDRALSFARLTRIAFSYPKTNMFRYHDEKSAQATRDDFQGRYKARGGNPFAKLWPEYRRHGFVVGDCGTYTPMQATLCKVLGVPAMAMYLRAPGMITHLYVAFYNQDRERFDNFTGQWSIPDRNAVHLDVQRPAWHHVGALPGKWLSGTTRGKAFGEFNRNGLSLAHLQLCFLTDLREGTDTLFR